VTSHITRTREDCYPLEQLWCTVPGTVQGLGLL
jgi:hypothetical protein